MTFNQNGFFTQTPGTTATAANSGNSGSPWTNDTITGGDTQMWQTPTTGLPSGFTASLVITPAASTSAYNDDVSFSSTTVVVGDAFYVPGTPTVNNIYIHNYRSGTEASSTSCAGIVLTTSLKFAALGSGGTTLTGSTSSTLTAGWYFITSQLTSNASTGNLPYQYYTWSGSSWNLVQSVTPTAGNTTGNTITMIRRGCTSASFSGAITNWQYGFIQTQDGTTTPLTPMTPPVFTPGAVTPSIYNRAALIRSNSW